MPIRRLRLAAGLGTLLLVLALGAGMLILVELRRAAAIEAANDRVERAARTAEATVNRQLLSIDGMLAGLGPLLAHLPSAAGLAPSEAANAVLDDLNFQNFNFRNLLLVHPDGRVWASGLPDARRRAPPIGRAVGLAGRVAIIGPARNQATGEWTLFFARDIELPTLGPMQAVAEVPVPQFAALLAPIGDALGMRLTVERNDGQLLVSLPLDAARLGTLLRRPQATATATLQASRLIDAPVRLVVRPTLYPDILMTVSLEDDAALADWRADRLTLRFGAATGMLLLLALGVALDRALREREHAEAARTHARRMLENALEAMPDGFVMFDAADRLVICNARYRDLYAASAPLMVPGARFEDIIREGARRGQYPQAGDDLDAFVAEVCAWHRGNHPPLERLLPEGRWLLITERRTPDGGTVGIRTDISALKAAMTELAAARDAAAAATAAKSRFLAQMSHELRTPLNGVLGLAQALAADARLPAEAQARAATLEAAGRHLVAVADDVLDLARVEAGRLILHPEPLALPALLEGACRLLGGAATDKSVTVTLRLAPDLPAMVEADATRLRQLLLNLLSNAVKFTEAGGEVVLLARRIGEAGGGRAVLRIEVRDSGPGVPEAARAAIFDDFVQLDGPAARGGAGLGLAISAHIVAAMGGRIGCADNPERPGALFWTELAVPVLAVPVPAPAAVAMRARTGAPAPPVARPGRLHVLVVDDVASNLAVARALLGSAGHEVTCVPGGAEALACIAAAVVQVDAVLMDVMMPGMDGLEATRRIRALPGVAARVPIIALTASAYPEDIAACHDAGMDAHLAKPVDRAMLLRVLAEQAARAVQDPGQLGLAGLDPEEQAELRRAFVEELEAAGQALEAARASRSVRSAAHRLVGAAATLRCETLAASARELERASRDELPMGYAALREATLALVPPALAALGEAPAAAA